MKNILRKGVPAILERNKPASGKTLDSHECAKVAAIIPAFNEETRIRAVLEAILDSQVVDEVIVVSDASTDRTYEVASSIPGIRPIQLPLNLGKGGAMGVGVEHTDAEIVVFLDADLIGLKPEHIVRLVEAIACDGIDLAVGVFRGGRFLTDLSQKLVACISGQRAMRRQFFLEVPKANTARFGIEVAITYYARRRRLRIRHVPLKGVTHPMKEEKLGPIRGFGARMKMYYEIAHYLVVTAWRERNGHVAPCTSKSPGFPETAGEPSDLSR